MSLNTALIDIALAGNAEGVRHLQPRAAPWDLDQRFHLVNAESVCPSFTKPFQGSRPLFKSRLPRAVPWAGN